MLFRKTVLLVLLVSLQYCYADDDPCNSGSFNTSTLSGILPYKYKDLVQIPNGTVCIYNFTVPWSYVLELKTDYYMRETDKITITNNLGEQQVYTAYGALFENTYYCPKGFCQVKVESNSKASFMTYFNYRYLSNYTSDTIMSGDWYQLNGLVPYHYIIYYCSNVAFTLAQNTSPDSMRNLANYYIYDSPNLSNGEYLGTLASLKNSTIYTTVVFVSVVNFYAGFDSDAYIIGNDASQIPSNYQFILTTPETMGSYQFSSYVNNEAAVTFGCQGCDQHYLDKLMFDTSVASNGYVGIQGRSPSQSYSLDKVLFYQPTTFSSNQLPQFIENREFTVYYYKTNFTIQFYSGQNYTGYQTSFVGREGLIASNTIWNREQWNGGSFNYTFSNNSQLFEYRINMTNLHFGNNDTDRLYLSIGTGDTTAVSLTWPGAMPTYVTGVGNWMAVESHYSLQTIIMLPFEVRDGTPNTTTAQTTTTAALITTPMASTTTNLPPTTSSITMGPTTQTTVMANSTTVTSTIATTTSKADSFSLNFLVLITLIIAFLF
ncbi:hypothetical protein B9Z55_026165 [Caenorhabditis nigoni]|uniref:CUB-like domain-containing protein n=1 Tax=Caenorhabditis nigoni TaxID=1611254 RepID=A0A2G5T240_9PELO|nr:hypothetical protein B9Z55_026165 [Caenorhabditis nigoni]